MSTVFAARYSITGIDDLTGGVWRVVGEVNDDSMFSYSAVDVSVGDIFVDENVWSGATNRWRIIEIVSAIGVSLICKVVWDDVGPPDIEGPVASEAAISRVSINWSIAEIPTQLFSKISENVQIKLQNINTRKNIDNITGGGGISGTSGYHAKFITPSSIANSVINEDDFGKLGIGKTLPDEKVDISSGAIQLEAMLAPLDPGADKVKTYVTAVGIHPSREVAWKCRLEDGSEVILASLLV